VGNDQPAGRRFYQARTPLDITSIRVVGILAAREASVDDLAASLDLRPPTVSHHLNRLKQAGLVQMRQQGTTHLYSLDRDALMQLSRTALAPERLASVADDVHADAWQRKVLRDFFDGERLKEIPASRKKRDVILRWLASRFEPGVRYSERQVNDVLSQHHEDIATLRRELVGLGLLERAHSIYQLAATP